MTDTTTEAVERLIARLEGQDPIPSRTEVAEQCTALLADRDRLAALLAASQSPDPVTNADSCQPFPKPQRNDGGQPCGECRLPDGEVCDICGASNQLTQPARTYEDGVRDAAKEYENGAWPLGEQPRWDYFNSAKLAILELIKEKSHE